MNICGNNVCSEKILHELISSGIYIGSDKRQIGIQPIRDDDSNFFFQTRQR